MSDDLDKLVRDLGVVPRYSGRFVRAALEKTSFEVKKAWREVAGPASGGHAAQYPHAIDYDVSGDFPHYEAEIGPNIGKQGSLGFLEDEHGGVKSAPHKAREKIKPWMVDDFERGLDRAVDDALKRAGL